MGLVGFCVRVHTAAVQHLLWHTGQWSFYTTLYMSRDIDCQDCLNGAMLSPWSKKLDPYTGNNVIILEHRTVCGARKFTVYCLVYAGESCRGCHQPSACSIGDCFDCAYVANVLQGCLQLLDTGELVKFEIPPENAGNLQEFNWSSWEFLARLKVSSNRVTGKLATPL